MIRAITIAAVCDAGSAAGILSVVFMLVTQPSCKRSESKPESRHPTAQACGSQRTQHPRPCTLASISDKLESNPGTESEWKLSGLKYWGTGVRPTSEVSLGLQPNGKIEQVASKHNAVSHELNIDGESFTLSFASVDVAVASVRPLLCDDAVAWAAMVKIVWVEGEKPDGGWRDPSPDGPPEHAKMELRDAGTKRPSPPASDTPGPGSKKP